MKEDFYISLLYKQLAGEISLAEEKRLLEWRSQSHENELEASSVELAWQATAPQQIKVEDVNIEDEFAQITKRIEEDNKENKGRLVQMNARKNRRRMWLVAAGFLLLILAGSFLFRESYTLDPALEWVEASTDEEVQTVLLADQSTVRLNKNSKLKYPVSFNGNERKVLLEGEAFFEVTSNANHPFVVETAQEKIRVLGTSFNVLAYPDKKETLLYVATGKVRFSSKISDESAVFTKNKGAGLDHITGKLIRKTQASANTLSWFTQELVFEETPLSEILIKIEHDFGVQFITKNLTLANCLIDATFDNTNIDGFIEDIIVVFGANIEKNNDKNYTINGGSCE